MQEIPLSWVPLLYMQLICIDVINIVLQSYMQAQYNNNQYKFIPKQTNNIWFYKGERHYSFEGEVWGGWNAYLFSILIFIGIFMGSFEHVSRYKDL